MAEERLLVARKSAWRVLNQWQKALLRREILTICLFIFITDMILGSMRPILSLFATSLGASLTLVGTLSGSPARGNPGDPVSRSPHPARGHGSGYARRPGPAAT
jgi:hypothetical protein